MHARERGIPPVRNVEPRIPRVVYQTRPIHLGARSSNGTVDFVILFLLLVQIHHTSSRKPSSSSMQYRNASNLGRHIRCVERSTRKSWFEGKVDRNVPAFIRPAVDPNESVLDRTSLLIDILMPLFLGIFLAMSVCAGETFVMRDSCLWRRLLQNNQNNRSKTINIYLSKWQKFFYLDIVDGLFHHRHVWRHKETGQLLPFGTVGAIDLVLR